MSKNTETEQVKFVPEPVIPREHKEEETQYNERETESEVQEADEDAEDRPKKKAYWIPTFLKVSLLGACCLGIYGIYLDGKIRSKMDGQIWQLPAEVYSRIESVRLDDKLTVDQVQQMLIDYGYREVNNIVTPGDFKFDEKGRLVLLRRAFQFPEMPEVPRVLRITFQNNLISRIEDLNTVKEIGEFRLDPKLISMIHSDNDEERQALHLHQYPQLLIDALLLTEDRRFFEHDGISLIGIARAIKANYEAGERVQGASTLTQQLVKNLFLTREKSLERKLNEILMSLILDFRYDKNTILETYLNEVYLGQNHQYQVHGFGLASQFYFGRPINEIGLSQIALLVGMVKAPSNYNPWRFPEAAKARRNVVLNIMRENGRLTQDEYDFLAQQPLGVIAKGGFYVPQPAFMQALNMELKQQLGENRTSLLSKGAKIFTTLDRKLQRSAELAVIHGLEDLENSSKKVKDLQSAMVVAEYRTGKVRAIVGDRNTQFAGFNRATQTKRQIGSTVKPSIYAIALADPKNFRLNTPIENKTRSVKVGSTWWTPKNYDGRTGGSVMLMDSLVRSLNIPTVNIGLKVGLKNVIAKQKEMGWDEVDIPPYPSTLLGAYSISPYDVTKSYQTIANEGVRIPLTTVESIIGPNGEIIYQPNLKERAKAVLPAEAAIQTMYAMQQVVERGTARSLQNEFAPLKLAGKTGTTNGAKDTWYVGVDGQHIATVWLGKDNNTDTHLTGSSGALQVYKEYLKRSQPIAYRLPKNSNLQWVGISSYGAWDCSSGRQIPVWRDKGQYYCTGGQIVQAGKPSVWDALSLNKEAQNGTKAEVSEDQSIPVEEIAPSE